MEKPVNTTITNMCLVYDGERYLVQDRRKDDYSGITFPGGHVEPGEAFTDAVIREVYEETGLTIASPQLCGIKDWCWDDGSRYMVLLYKTRYFSGTLRSSAEGEVFWVKRSRLDELPLAQDMGEMLRLFEEDALSEFFYYKEDGQWKSALK